MGIQVKLDLSVTATWFSRLGAANFDLAPYYVRFGPDPDAYREHFGSKGPRNFGKYSNPAVDQLLDDGTKTGNLTRRKQIYDKVQEILRKDFVYVPVGELAYLELSKSKLHGTPLGDPTSYGKAYGWAGLRALWWEQ